MKLGQKQNLFTWLEPLLIDKAHELGFEVRRLDTFRDPRAHGDYGELVGYSKAYSMHKLKIACDLALILNYVYLQDDESYRELGEWWESLHYLCKWGGEGDGNHFSLTHDERW